MLLDHGHPEARRYPLGMLFDESSLVIERLNGAIVTEANLLQSAVHGILSKKAREEFSRNIQKLNVQTSVIEIGEDGEREGGDLPRLLPQGY